MPNPYFLRIFPLMMLLSGQIAAQTAVTASFTAPAQVCVNTPVQVQNTSVGYTNCFWSFCAADFSTTPEAVNLGNPGNLLASPTFGCYQLDDNGNYYGLVTSYNTGDLIRLNFGTSLLNTPTAEDLGTFNGVIPEQSEGIQLIRINGDWSAIMVGGGNQVPNSSPRIVRIDFGSSLASTPVATNWGNVGGLNLPHDLYITNQGGNYYGFAINVNDNTITRLSFGPNFNSTPTGVNLGNIGNINYPAGFTFINYNQNWYCFIANRVTNSLTRLSFGTSLLNTPVGVNIGNPGNTLDYPRDISLFTVCDGVYGFVVNETSNDLVKLNFGNDLLSNPQATNLGNVGSLSFPHSISDFFRVGNDIYAFIPNVVTSSLTRIRFAGCQNIPGSNQANPAAVSYPQAGTYNINLTVDIGLPTQTSVCQQIVVNPAPQATIAGDTICIGSSAALAFNATAGTAPFALQYTVGNNNYTLNGMNATAAISSPSPLTSTVTFDFQTLTDANGCSAQLDTIVSIVVNPLPQGGISGDRACIGDSVNLYFSATAGITPFQVELSDGTNNTFLSNIVSGTYIHLPPITTPATYSLISMASENGTGCTRTSGFTSPTASFAVYPSPQVSFASLGAVCLNTASFPITQAAETTGLPGAGVYGGAGIDARGNFSPARAGVGNDTLTYTYTATDGCIDSASSVIVINPLPLLLTTPNIYVCGEVPVTMTVSGAAAYLWSPSLLLNDASSSHPVANVDSTTTFIVEGTDSNNCTAADTVTIHVTRKYLLVVPSAFTPNGDGHNDCFGIQRWDGVTVKEFSIFNRQGQKIFSTQNPADCWDGTFKGQPQPSGGYVYVIEANSACGNITRTGMVILVR